MSWIVTTTREPTKAGEDVVGRVIEVQIEPVELPGEGEELADRVDRGSSRRRPERSPAARAGASRVGRPDEEHVAVLPVDRGERADQVADVRADPEVLDLPGVQADRIGQ